MNSDEPSRRVVVLIYPGCTIGEVIELATRLVDAHVEVAFLAVGPQAIADRSGLQIQPDAILDELDPAALDAVIVPGGDPEAIIDDPQVAGLLDAAASTGALVAGICAGVLVIASAGLLRGRSITHNYRPPWAPLEISTFVERFWEEAKVESDPSVGVVVDGQIVTALPNATIGFAMTVCRELGLYTAEHADLVGRHLRGEYVAELYDRR